MLKSSEDNLIMNMISDLKFLLRIEDLCIKLIYSDNRVSSVSYITMKRSNDMKNNFKREIK